MIDRNGGYAIIDLKGKTLSGTPTTILGTHAAIAKAIAGSKPILLTGLTTGGPCFVQISVDGTSYVISGVYGNDITITSADAVTSAEASGGGGLASWSYYEGDDQATYTFQFVPGMTWADFAASDYNIDDIITADEEGVAFASLGMLGDTGGDGFAATDDVLESAAKGITLIV